MSVVWLSVLAVGTIAIKAIGPVVLDERLAGLTAAAVLLLLRAPLRVVIVAAAAVTALARAL